MITRYVDPDAAVGGNGTTNSLTGGTCAYRSLNIAEAALPASAADAYEIVCGSNHANHTADTAGVSFAGTTTSASNYIWVHTDPASKATPPWSDSKYRMSVTNATVVTINESYVRVSDLQLESISPTNSPRSAISNTASVGGLQVFRNLIRGHNSGTYYQIVMYWQASGTDAKVYDNIIYNLSTVAGNYGIRIVAGVAVDVYNNTIIGGAYGISNSGTSVAINNLCQGQSSAALAGTFAAGSDYNATNRATMGYTVTGGGNTHDRTSQTFTFVDAAGGDYHLAATDAGAKDCGLSDPGAGLFLDDIDGITRTGTWDIGADEYVSAVVISATGAVATRKAVTSASGAHVTPAFSATATVATRKSTASAAGTHAAPSFTATAAVATRRATVSASATHAAPVFAATGAVVARKAIVSASGAATIPEFSASATVATRKATAEATGNYAAPTFSAAASVATRRVTVQALGTWSVPEATGVAAVATRRATVNAVARFRDIGITGILRVILPPLDGTARHMRTFDGLRSFPPIDGAPRQLRRLQ